MSDKKLLNENTIRRFMKLANVGAMTDNFVNEMYGSKMPKRDEEEKKMDEAAHEDEEKKMEEAIEEGEESIEEGAHEDDEKKMEESVEDCDEALEEEVELTEDEIDLTEEEMDMDDDGDADISLSEEEAQLLIDLGSRLSAAMGDAGDDEPEMDMDMDDEPEMDMDDDDEEDPMMQEEIVQEVLKRVTQRIIREKMKRK